jgi:beta-1,2-mannobiose phosphorylase / 1,2-beta-oligomannan phosphorylase
LNPSLQRYNKNPILKPINANWWESEAVFNPAILYDGDKVHMLYRAVGKDDNYISRIGYASSVDGFNFQRQNGIAMGPVEDYEKYGLEDPRLIQIDSQIFITYVVLSDYVSRGPIGSTALATTTDFKEYVRFGIITSKGSNNKDVVLFHEKINNKYLFLHRPTGWVGEKFGVDKPSIWLGEGGSLTNFENHTILLRPKYQWEDSRIGSGPPPIKTKKGWLLIYHGVDTNLVYRTGAVLLDISDPSKVVGRTENPILEPEELFEKTGYVKNVVFPTGSCIIDDDLFLYYGGADKVCCVATVKLDSLLERILSKN